MRNMFRKIFYSINYKSKYYELSREYDSLQTEMYENLRKLNDSEKSLMDMKVKYLSLQDDYIESLKRIKKILNK